MRFPIAAALIVLAEAASAQEPYDLRGFRLGATADEFKSVPFPDPVKKGATIFAACTPDKDKRKGAFLDGLEPDDRHKAIGVTYCGHLLKSPSGTGSWTFDFAGIGNYQKTFSFTPPVFSRDGKPRLYMITTGGRSEHYADVSAAMTEKYGHPTSRETKAVRIAMGVTHQNEISIWNNGVSSITLSQYSDSIRTFGVVYRHEDLAKRVTQALEAQARRGAGKL